MQRLLIATALALLAVGCGPTQRTYSVSVHNAAAEPMTVWLTKDGPPAEPRWLAPEQIAVMGAPSDAPISGVIIPAGKTADIGPVKGDFDSGTNAVLRVYRGQKLFNQILATGPDSPNRTDVVLHPGANQFLIDDSGKPKQQQ